MLIPTRFNGPPDSGNGGWAAGAMAMASIARAGGAPVQVTLRVPPPLGTPMSIVDGQVLAGDILVAEVATATDAGAAVPPVELAEAAAAARGYPGFAAHPFPTCYVCGPDRVEGDGLRIFPGPVGDGRTAAPWAVPSDVTAETLWAALDCPGGWSVLRPDKVYVLGRITAIVRALPTPGSRCVVVGVADSTQGRKAQVRSTVYGPEGRPLAIAWATWISPG